MGKRLGKKGREREEKEGGTKAEREGQKGGQRKRDGDRKMG